MKNEWLERRQERLIDEFLAQAARLGLAFFDDLVAFINDYFAANPTGQLTLSFHADLGGQTVTFRPCDYEAWFPKATG